MFDDHSPHGRPLRVAEVADDEPFRKKPAYRATAEVSVYVAGEYRRRGVGRRLLAEAIRRSTLFGGKTLTGGIFAHNRPSIEPFEKRAHYPRVAELASIERDLVVP